MGQQPLLAACAGYIQDCIKNFFSAILGRTSFYGIIAFNGGNEIGDELPLPIGEVGVIPLPADSQGLRCHVDISLCWYIHMIPQFSFRGGFQTCSRAYLVQHQRPVLVKDFFDTALTLEIRLKPRNKTLRIGWGDEASVVPE